MLTLEQCFVVRFPAAMGINNSVLHWRLLFIVLFRRTIVKFVFRLVKYSLHYVPNVITEFAEGIVCVEDDQRLFGKREMRFHV